jgi:CubicO group peptidase (beta-lactamase class C family)
VSIIDERMSDLRERISQEIDQGLLPSCQFAVGLDGDVIAHEAFGDATTDTRYVMFSATKGFVAGAMYQLIDEGSLDVSRPVSEYFPEFAANGKEAITVEQVMTHTSGFPMAPLPPALWSDHDGRVEKMATWRLNWEPGTRFEYHPTSAHWVLAEILQRLDGRDFRESIRARINEPLGLTRFALGVPPEDQGDIATLVSVGEEPSSEELQRLFGISTFDHGEVTAAALLELNGTAERAAGLPAGGGVTDAADIARYYQALLHNPDKLWDPANLIDFTRRIRTTLPDPLLGHPANRSLGLIVAGDDGKANLRGMGHNVSAEAFGHNGAGGQIAWADPVSGLSFAYLTNGLDQDFLREARRTSGIGSRAGLLTTVR